MKTFVEIGCADFDTLIPLAEKGGWCGWCIEPVPHHAETLRKKAAGLPVGVEEVAISDYDGHLTMAVGGGPDWARGASHVISKHHLGARLLDHPNNAKLRIDEIEVTCLKLETFMAQNNIGEIDFMKIDVEGHELNVLRSFSWCVQPKVLKIEHVHLSGNELDKLLKRQGYTIFVEARDIYAIL